MGALPFRFCFRLILILAFGITGIRLEAQNGIALRTKRIPSPKQPFQLDSLTLVTYSLRCVSDTGIRFRFDFKSNLVSVVSGSFSGDSVTFQYAVYPFAAYKPVFRYNRQLYDSLLRFTDYPEAVHGVAEKREELFSLPGIQKSGTITRGISVGNNQNGFVNSSLNLQLEGDLSPGLHLTAVLSDQNVPFQPQGNTQQIRELDRVYIQLDHKQGQMIAGDVVLRNEPSQFLRYYKNIQGAQITGAWDSTRNSVTRVAGGIAKGKFASIVIAVKEGVQGPYRLRPPYNPDITVVILAASERIFLDSRLLKRGFNQDYVIDYNTGEITLNNKLLITRYSRLRADFEYSERYYSRTIWMGEHTEKVGMAEVKITHYQEQDNPNRPLAFSLDTTNRRILAEAGDDPNKAVFPTAVAVSSITEGLIYYNRKDTVLNGNLISLYQYNAANTGKLYEVSFTLVGEGKGDYQLVQNLGNGKVFAYVGQNAGSYIPVRVVVLPNLRAVSRASVVLRPSASHTVEVEGALSRYDRNRFSRLDEADNPGNSQYLGYSWTPANTESQIHRKAELNYMRLSRNFNPIDRFRPIEFDRNWNAQTGDTLRADDHLVQGSGQVSQENRWLLKYTGAYRNKGANVKGTQQTLDLQHGLGPLVLTHQGFLMRNFRQDQFAKWERLTSQTNLPVGGFIPGYRYQLDQNAIRQRTTDSVLATAMNYTAHSVFISTKDTTRRILFMDYTYREDKRPQAGELKKNLFSHNGTLRLGSGLGKDHRVDLVGNYRRYTDGQQGDTTRVENFMGRADYAGSLWDGALRQEFTYTANTGQEQKRTFQFIRVTDLGQGTHKWIDLNGNGLQELDEFVEALRPEDRQYIKIFIPTSDFVKAYTNLLNYRLNLSAPSGWQSDGGVKSLLSRFSLLSSISSEQKSVEGTLRDRYVPLIGIRKSTVLSASRIFRHTVFWNRTRSDMGGEYSLVTSQQKTLLSNGFSLRRIVEHRFLIRKNLGPSVNFSPSGLLFRRSFESDALPAQNYQVQGYEVGPEFSFQPGTANRISGTAQYSDRQNTAGEEKTRLWKVGLEYRYNQQSNRTLNAYLRFTHIEQMGSATTQAAYELMEGLSPGNNLTLNLQLQQKLSQGLQLVVSYDGRKSEGQKLIHVGKVQANLLF